MNNGYSRSQQRREAARKYAVQCMNARGEVECSECGAGVDEARGNRNAQELDREKIRKSSKGPICNACQASWRYSHHQEPEMANAKDKTENLDFENGKLRCSCGGDITKIGDDRWECDDCNQLYEADDWARGGPDNPDKLKAVQNAASHTDTCDFCGKDYQCNRIKHDVLKCPDCGGPSTMIKNAYGCGICGEKGHVYDVDGDKKILCEKHAKESGGVLLSNADNAKCQCGHTYDQHKEDSDGTMPCTKCSCSSYYPERGFKDHIKGLEK